MIRFICIAVFLILYLILSIPVFLVEWIIGKFNRRAKDISSLRIVQWGFKVILKMTGVTTTVIGEEKMFRMNRYSLSATTAVILIFSYLQPVQASDRLCCQKRNGKDSASFHMDEESVLSLP